MNLPLWKVMSSAASIMHTLHFFCPVILCIATVRCVGLNGLNEKGGSLCTITELTLSGPNQIVLIIRIMIGITSHSAVPQKVFASSF